jgi:hypothetical protein
LRNRGCGQSDARTADRRHADGSRRRADCRLLEDIFEATGSRGGFMLGVAANGSPVGFVGLLIEQYGQDGEITRDEFMWYGLHAATGFASTQAGAMTHRWRGVGSNYWFRNSQHAA